MFLTSIANIPVLITYNVDIIAFDITYEIEGKLQSVATNKMEF